MATDRDYWNSAKVIYPRRRRSRRGLLNKRRLWAILALASFCAAYLGLYAVLHLRSFRITEIHIQGTESLDPASIHTYLDTALAGDRWHFLPRSNILFFSVNAAENSLKKEFPEIASVIVSKTLPHTVAVQLVERQIWAVYCYLSHTDTATDTPIASENQNDALPDCYYLDHDGVAFSHAPSVLGSLIVRIDSDAPVRELGAVVLDVGAIDAFGSYQKNFSTIADIEVIEFRLNQNAPKDVWLRASDGFDVIVTKDDDAARVAGVVKTVINQKIKGDRKNLLYIDARFGNKVFYKLANGK
ncbi:MAG: FtsQ-type POTRA domain-containing protein [Candidatus Sungbacteria bacterium]|uniref:FtsQ-type POTRA domain-containing protein n=1 Tax=Candidatus Sungiibacteriota bacterium TaxID=2750080 RepID=A0A9D6LNT6_9BACT|nr:FtsQ-type POTRA domain-containing protein [Candidatus Sungbacteria bacterium]